MADGGPDQPARGPEGRGQCRGAGAGLRWRTRRAHPRRQRPRKSARRDPEDSRSWQGLAHRCRLAEGRRDVPRRHQGQCGRGGVRRRRADLHGTQQPEPAQLAVPRLLEAVGDLYRRQDQLDRPGAGRLQRPPAAVDRHRHRRFRHHRDGRAVRGRHRRQGPARRDARLGEDADRRGRPRRLPEAPVGTWDGKTYRITIDGDCHTFAYRKDYLTDGGDQRGDRHDRGAHHLGSGQRVLQEGGRPNRPADRAGGLRLPRPAEIPMGRLRLLLP